jgi:hypothetical protein
MVSPPSQCPEMDRKTGPKSNYCIEVEDNDVVNVSFNMKCTWDTIPVTLFNTVLFYFIV